MFNPLTPIHMKEVQLSDKRFTRWTYVVKADQQVLGSFPSASLAYGHWLAYAEKYNKPDDPICSCTRYRVRVLPYELQQQDVTLSFMKMWENLLQSKSQNQSES